MAGPYPVTYNINDVVAAQIIDDATFIELSNLVNQERTRRGYGSLNYQFTGSVEATELNAMVEGLNSAGYTAGFAGVDASTIINNTHINALIDKLQAAGAVCICNCNYCTCDCNYCTCDCNYCTCDCNYCTCDCNYCTCDCNYCTCNCNYACTCNCNYSDETLKTQIVYM